jgi:hypothetical protein
MPIALASPRRGAITSVLIPLFGLAVVCALGAIVAFTTEMLMAGTGIRAEVAHTSKPFSLRYGSFRRT